MNWNLCNKFNGVDTRQSSVVGFGTKPEINTIFFATRAFEEKRYDITICNMTRDFT